MDKLHFTFKPSGQTLTEKEVKEVREIMATIIARYIVKNRK